MAKLLPGRRPLGKKVFSRTIIAVVVVAIAAVSITVLSFAISNSSTSVQASTNVTNQTRQTRYKATRPLVADPQTGKLRLPNQKEINQTIESLKVLANRPENLPQALTTDGAVVSDLEGGFGGVMLARPNSDGTWETKCVFTLEEGTNFLGLIEVTFKE